jgi:hypothetical protein
MSEALSLAPLIPWPIIAVLGAAAAVMLVFAAARNVRGTALRTIAIAVLVLALLNPRVVREDREPQPDVAVVVVDDSASQGVGARTRQTTEALESVSKALDSFDDLEIRVIRAHEGGAANDSGESEEGTRLFAALGRAVADVPRRRLAGAVLVTDGQVHDVPETLPPMPVHVLLTGGRGEMDRRLIIEKAPGYGIVGKEVGIVYRVEERAPAAVAGQRRDMVKVVLRVDGKEAGSALVPVGRNDRISFVLEHAGPTVLELEAAPAEGELSTLNNRSVVAVNGVRDRLRVLLVSGQPHAGERTWRNLMKSDPSVDLVHFTILRPPEKDDFTPLKELSLIVFPVQELFETKLHEFDLIVFDRYMVRDVLPPSYLRNVGDYLRKGGAILLAVGPEFAGVRSLYQTALGKVMPAIPTGRVLEKGYRPAPTEVGRRHPVTATLDNGGADGPRWGRWFRQVEAGTRSGTVLMRGLENLPLLVLDRVEKGRIAQLMSDHIWLWARGYEGGGPQAELLRRLAHWLMKEPDLEEEGLTAHVRDGRLTIERRSLSPDPVVVTVTAPSGAAQAVGLETGGDGIARAVVAATETGLYRVGDGTRTSLAAAGALNPLELSDLRATADILAPVAEATRGGLAWLAEGMPDVRRAKAGRQTAGRGWIGLRRNEAYVVTGVVQVSLLPGFLVLGLVLGALMLAWYREGR